MGILDSVQRGALNQPQGILGAGVDPQFYKDLVANLVQTLGVPLPSEREGMARLAQDPQFKGHEMDVFRSMTSPAEQGILAQNWDDKLNQLGILGLTVYHGSPHKFDKFDSSKIGTGEGAQAYGHGLYLAENPNVARGYAQSTSRVPDRKAWNELSAIMRKHDIPGDFAPWDKPDSAAGKILHDYAHRLSKKELERVRGLVNSNLYKVDLPDEQIAKMLDWDKPLSQQPEVITKLRALNDRFVNELLDTHSMDVLIDPARGVFRGTGGDFVKALGVNTTAAQNHGLTTVLNQGAKHGEEASAIVLRQAGIPGIKYLDAGSRAAGEGSRNFVVFPGNEGILKILGRE